MSDPISRRLQELNLRLPPAAPPAAAYLPWLQSGNLVFISGQLPMDEGKIRFTGKVGADLDI